MEQVSRKGSRVIERLRRVRRLDGFQPSARLINSLAPAPRRLIPIPPGWADPVDVVLVNNAQARSATTHGRAVRGWQTLMETSSPR